MCPGTITHAHDRQTGRSTQAFARAGHENVSLAVIRMNIHASEGRDGIHQKEGAVAADDFANLSDRVQRARGRIVMHQADNRDIGPLLEGLPHLFGVDGLIVRHLDLQQFLVVAV